MRRGAERLGQATNYVKCITRTQPMLRVTQRDLGMLDDSDDVCDGRVHLCIEPAYADRLRSRDAVSRQAPNSCALLRCRAASSSIHYPF
jgi:hypothetical protein